MFNPSLVQPFSDLSGFVKLSRKFVRRQISERRMRSVFVVIGPPLVDPSSCV